MGRSATEQHDRSFWWAARAFVSKMRASDTWILAALLSLLRHRLGGRNLIANQRVLISGASHIVTIGRLQIGVDPVGFCHRYDRTYLNVRGRLTFTGPYSVGKGCRIDVGPMATVSFGKGSITADTKIIISHRLNVGAGTIIAWGCQLLDDDFHSLHYDGQKPRELGISIGSNVWIGSNVIILKGAVIPDGCVVAAGSIVTKVFEEPCSLIGGSPARVLRSNVVWDQK